MLHIYILTPISVIRYSVLRPFLYCNRICMKKFHPYHYFECTPHLYHHLVSITCRTRPHMSLTSLIVLNKNTSQGDGMDENSPTCILKWTFFHMSSGTLGWEHTPLIFTISSILSFIAPIIVLLHITRNS
jgi:hypothetical protein